MLSLFDTASGSVRPLRQREADKVSMYVCGPTVYGPPHLGHGRFSLVFDILRRYLEWSGNEVTYVSNITDIDDKIINLAAQEQRDWREIVAHYEQVWYQAMDLIGVKRPTHDPHATAYVEHMVSFIGSLIDHGDAYVTSDGVYFRCAQVSDYGLLARQTIESLQAGARVESSDEKESPIDFALWKFVKPGEPSWPAPFGDGRPGWHTECVVMSTDLLGAEFDLHGGGLDLAFPHHENERAQAAACGHRFAGHWVHNGFVETDGEKMSKSLGNFTTLLDLAETTDPRSYRMLCLQSHYRSPIEVSDHSLSAAASSLGRIESALRRAIVEEQPDADEVLRAQFRERMDNDLDTPAAMVLVFDAVTETNRCLDAGDTERAAVLAATIIDLCGALGLFFDLTASELPEHVVEMCRLRDAARADKDWAQSDALRDQIVALGYAVEDTADGTRVHLEG